MSELKIEMQTPYGAAVLSVESGKQEKPIKIDGENDAAQWLANELANEYDFVGHRIGDATTIQSIHFVLVFQKEKYQPQIVQGFELIEGEYEMDIPADAVS